MHQLGLRLSLGSRLPGQKCMQHDYAYVQPGLRGERDLQWRLLRPTEWSVRGGIRERRLWQHGRDVLPVRERDADLQRRRLHGGLRHRERRPVRRRHVLFDQWNVSTARVRDGMRLVVHGL
jgi:hypothetical protein